jgi:hypothetical protein
MSEAFVFEIKGWEPSYSLSINRMKDRPGPYSEFLNAEIATQCISPKHLVGRAATFSLFGERDMLDLETYKSDPNWKPRCIGMLELKPSYGRFYATVPHESLASIIPALIKGMYRFIMVSGPPLKRSCSFCDSFHLMTKVDPEDL